MEEEEEKREGRRRSSTLSPCLGAGTRKEEEDAAGTPTPHCREELHQAGTPNSYTDDPAWHDTAPRLLCFDSPPRRAVILKPSR